MKYKAKIYAKALADSILDSKAENKKIINNFLKLLERNQDLKKSEEIVLIAENMLLKKTGNKKVILEIARKIDTKDAVKDFVKKGDVIEEKINPKLVAGIKVIVNNDKQLDFSLLRKLENIF